MSEADLQLKVYQTVMAEHGSNTHAALLDMCARYVRLYNGVSPGYLRWGMNDTGADLKFDPPPVDDGSWIATGREP